MFRLPVAVLPSRPRISVVIPCYNYGVYLEDCVESALSQRDVDIDVTIIDDASTDDSAVVAQRICDRDPRVRLVRHEANLGHLRTANEALQSATGDYLVKLDADDLLTPGSLARSAALLMADSKIGFVYGYAQDLRGATPTISDSQTRYWAVWSGHAWLRMVLRRAHNVIAQPEVMIRRQALIDVGEGYSLKLPWAEDYHLWLRLASRWRVGYVGGCIQGLYRIHALSLQRSAKDLLLSDLRARVDATRLFLTESPDNTRLYGRLALRALARDSRIVLAARIERDRDTPADTIAEYVRISQELEVASATNRAHGPMTWQGPLGRRLRWIRETMRWRRWRLIGV
ncbi:glycosyltransferase family A protein [Rhizobium sp. 2MFCol3.1]|uniref:glycosyltransferase family 2 protein n=1 Tax=Rhizobium sp. 2MFCol3.1 TaxID=1246459 RepID=UPI0009DA7CAB|nr:glycosyltransferase family A protein [Rhizobium sp. 2MFCol3.1]